MNGDPDIRLTALLTCRNAEATLARCLEHLAWHGAEIVVIDNGSTDSSADIARGFLGGAVAEVRDDPYCGAFDLTRQLRLKRDLIRDIGAGWVIHADADEFLDTPDGQPLRDYLGLWNKSDVLAFPCDEVMFLPRSDDERHAAESFEETMRACVRIADRNPKQRVFRATLPMSRWMATGGHTVAGPADTVAPVALCLRHYFGLSLDQIRADYLSRIYAPEDLGKLWHGTRLGTETEVIAPDPDLLYTPENLATAAPLHNVPVFAPRPAKAKPTRAEGPVDLDLVSFSAKTDDQIAAMIDQFFPGLRVARATPPRRPGTPRLVVFEHPARDLPLAIAKRLPHAEHWLRFSASARQQGLAGNGAYADLRREDLDDLPGLLLHTVRRLLASETMTPLLTATDPIRSDATYSGRFRDITGPLARDLGYG